MPPRDTGTLAERIDACLPQTQCRRCGYDGCRPYAEAVAAGASIDRCGPGGDPVIEALAAVTGRAPLPLAPDVGAPGPLLRAVIDEARCIGCTLCIQACPVDAIVGAQKRMHTVLPAFCTGCELCIPPCPVDCIELRPAGRRWSAADADAARSRVIVRDARRGGLRHAPVSAQRIGNAAGPRLLSADERANAATAALARARARRQRQRA